MATGDVCDSARDLTLREMHKLAFDGPFVGTARRIKVVEYLSLRYGMNWQRRRLVSGRMQSSMVCAEWMGGRSASAIALLLPAAGADQQQLVI